MISYPYIPELLIKVEASLFEPFVTESSGQLKAVKVKKSATIDNPGRVCMMRVDSAYQTRTERKTAESSEIGNPARHDVVEATRVTHTTGIRAGNQGQSVCPARDVVAGAVTIGLIADSSLEAG